GVVARVKIAHMQQPSLFPSILKKYTHAYYSHDYTSYDYNTVIFFFPLTLLPIPLYKGSISAPRKEVVPCPLKRFLRS
ncbi:hypothetical protein, partial [Acidaminococcus fermentans]|uniref:hypothetical protein n=1 Tax=Acidaminococcus fermentans TaxID=905 RepID=UPI00241CB8A0